MNDKIVLEYLNSNRYKKWDKRDKNILNYILNRFNDLTCENIKDKYIEAQYRLKHNIENCPKCEMCGKPLKFLGGFYESGCIEHKQQLANKRLSETSIKKYGTHRPSQNSKVKQKQAATNIQKYGYISALQNNETKEKTKCTLLNKFGVDNIAKSDYWLKNVNQTSYIKYGTLYPNQSEIVKDKIKSTTFSHYGVDNYFKSERSRIKALSEEAKLKSIETKRKNGTLNTSKPEDKTFILLKEKFKEVKRNYRDKERYPWHADFYIPELDLFIECNYHWTHGDKPYDINDLECKNKLKELEEKAKISKYYQNVIYTWVDRDVRKRNKAKENNLNYIEFWNINEFKEWINQF